MRRLQGSTRLGLTGSNLPPDPSGVPKSRMSMTPAAGDVSHGRDEEPWQSSSAAMDLMQVRHFLALARTLNFTRAAELCNITQPAFTRSIQRLEELLGGPLILRERALTQLTELGRAMLPLLQSAHDAAKAVRVRAANHRREEDAAPFRLGLAPSVPLGIFRPVLRQIAERIQGLELTLRREPAAALVEAMLHGEIDAVVLPEDAVRNERLNTWPLWDEQVVVLAPEGHRLAGLQAVKAAALDGEVLIAAEPPGVKAAERKSLRRRLGSPAAAARNGSAA
jgi:DNA-binding transcriptional LysR family regulator